MPGLAKSYFSQGKIISLQAWSERHFTIKIEVEFQPFLAGQFVRLQMPVGNTIEARTYSLVNSPTEPLLEIYFNTVSNGVFSNALAKLKPGDTIEVSQPASGFFVLNEVPESRDLWMFATGTGVGPYVSMLREGQIWQRFERSFLVHSASHADELAYAEELAELQRSKPTQFNYLSCVTRETYNKGLNKRFSDALADGSLEDHLGATIHKEHSHIMLCGNHHMLDDMKKCLAERGLQRHLRHKPGHITTEQYF